MKLWRVLTTFESFSLGVGKEEKGPPLKIVLNLGHREYVHLPMLADENSYLDIYKYGHPPPLNSEKSPPLTKNPASESMYMMNKGPKRNLYGAGKSALELNGVTDSTAVYLPVQISFSKPNDSLCMMNPI